jgi:hypothetical protein
MDDRLTQVSGELELRYSLVGLSQVMSEIQALQLSLSSDDPVDLLGEVLILDLFIIEEF